MIQVHETLMAVEDEDDDVVLLQRAFRNASVANPTQFLRDGEGAIKYLSRQGEFADEQKYPLPSLILLDLKLPRKTGLEVLAWVRSQPVLRRIPIVILSNSKQNNDLERAYDLGANSYLVKPVEFGDLQAMIQELKLYWMVLNECPPQPHP